LVGSTFSKTWNGADWAKLPRPEKPPLLSPAVLSKKGKRKLDQAIIANNRQIIENWKLEAASYRKRVVKRQRERRYEVHPYSSTVIETESCDLWSQYSYAPVPAIVNGVVQPRVWKDEVKGTMEGPPAYSFIPWTSEDDYIMNEKIKRALLGSDFNAGVFAAESHQALTMIFSSARRLALALRAAKKGDFLRALRHLRPEGSSTRRDARVVSNARSISNFWLEASYGWLPLVSDLQAGAEALAHMTNMPFSHTVRARRKKGGQFVNWNPDPSVNNMYDIGTVVSHHQVIATLREVDVPQLLGLTDWQSILWEKTPWSFVADWAIPIGNYLSARGIAQALTGTYVTTHTYRVNLTDRRYTDPIARPENFFYERRVLVKGDYGWRRTDTTRTISSTLSPPLPQVRGIGEAYSWRRAANAVALLIQQRLK